MKKIPYQINNGQILALVRKGENINSGNYTPAFLTMDAQQHIEDYNNGVVKTISYNQFLIERPKLVLKNFHLSAPLIVFFEITNLCNLKCDHCYANSQYKRPNELSTEKIKKVLDELDEAGVHQVFLTGGEIFAHKDAIEIIKYAMSKRFICLLITNGLLVTEEKLAQIPKGDIFFAVSFDTAIPEKTIRGKLNYPKLKKVLTLFKKYGHRCTTLMSVHKYNLELVKETFDWCDKHNFASPLWSELFLIGRSMNFRDMFFWKEEYADKVMEIYKECVGRYYKKDADENWGAVKTLPFATKLANAVGRGKRATSIAYISSNGNVYPDTKCVGQDLFNGGCLRENSFADIWKYGFNEIRKNKFEDFKQCTSCPVYLEGIPCNGRNEVLAKNVSGDFLGCGYTPFMKKFSILRSRYANEMEKEGRTLVYNR